MMALAVAVTGCTDDDGPIGTGGSGGGVGGSGGGMGGSGGMAALSVSATPSCAGGSAACNDVNNVVFETTQDVTLEATPADATIWYTTDGNLVVVEGAGGAGGAGMVVSDSAQEYDGTPLTLTENTVLRFAAEGADGMFSEASLEGYVQASGITQEQWAVSGHGAITDEPWRHWDEDGDVQTSCAKCHTAGGFLEYTATGAVATAQPLPAGLACNACHEGASFPNIYVSALGDYPFLEPVVFPSELTATYTNASNICMTCHQGRESTVSVNEDIAACSNVGDCDADCTPMEGAGGAGGAGGASGCEGLGFVNIHYYAAAATLFGTNVKGAYEYAGQTYAGQNEFDNTSHANNNLQDCLGCHMQRGEAADLPNHVFLPAVAACGPCHTGGAEFSELDNGLSDNFQDVQTMLTDLLTAITDYTTDLGDPVTYDPDSYPYWFNSEGGRYRFDAPSLRAAYNYQTGSKDPGNYIHNATYTKQFLYDSIIDMGGTTTVTRP